MHETPISDSDFEAAFRYLNGDVDDAAEDAYFEAERIALSADLNEGIRILERLAAGVDEANLDSFGAGFLETFLRARGGEDPARLEEALCGNARLLRALRGVNPVAIPSALAFRLS